ncbi:hypothetical protein VTK56DRAFT_2547 [Thermocarpiscus australiensis]
MRAYQASKALEGACFKSPARVVASARNQRPFVLEFGVPVARLSGHLKRLHLWCSYTASMHRGSSPASPLWLRRRSPCSSTHHMARLPLFSRSWHRSMRSYTESGLPESARGSKLLWRLGGQERSWVRASPDGEIPYASMLPMTCRPELAQQW